MKEKTPICDQESPDIDPNVQIKKDLIFSDGAKNCKTPMMAEANPAIIIPMMIKPAVELIREEKNTIIINPIIAPIKDAKHNNHGLFKSEFNPKMADKKITMATPNPDAEVMPKTDGSAKGFLNNSCKSKPLTGKAIPAKMAAIVLGRRKSKINFLAISSFPIENKETSAFPIFKLRKNIPKISISKRIMTVVCFKLTCLHKYNTI